MFLYISNGLPEKEIKIIIPFRIASRTRKYVGINLAKVMKDLYNENFVFDERYIRRHTNEKISFVHGSEQ